MVTLITEKLQNQSLDDLTCKTYNIHLYSSEKLNKSGSLFPFEINEESPWKALNGGCPIQADATKNSAYPFPVCPFSRGTANNVSLQWQQESSSTSMVSGWISELNLNENSGQPLAPPTKRHCRSLSEPDELARCRSPWKPGSSKVWTPVSKRRCNSGGSATLQRCNSHGSANLQRSTSISLPQNVLSLNNVFTITSFNTSPVPRPSSASSGFVDSSEGSTSSSIRWNSGGPCDFNPRRRLSLSQEHITETGNLLPSANSTPTSTPELSRRQGLLRCRSQPCVLNEKKSRLKRRREEDVRWNRPSLDFFKMTRDILFSLSILINGICSQSARIQDELICRSDNWSPKWRLP
ncbi:protein FAM53A isoform X4 [Malaclemys terrapin pileata]|uniref:protein FAM53A isoform X4 n=2 Tax=Malaclemys terrapin pileata TaxID=2991368 RepID=UPI0023A8DEA3|nr:protein FAM53A isoform X4 [Malaclemys terrapin pileata]